MFHRVSLLSSGREASERFYETVLAALGVTPGSDFALLQADDERPATRGLHIGFGAASHTEVDEFWRAGTAAGYRDDGPPGPRPEYGDDYYGGFLLDPDGNSAEGAHHYGVRRDGVVDHSGSAWPTWRLEALLRDDRPDGGLRDSGRHPRARPVPGPGAARSRCSPAHPDRPPGLAFFETERVGPRADRPGRQPGKTSVAMATQSDKAEAFRALHEGEPFVIPNPWDAGSARVLEALGFKALATTSSGFAFTLGRLDGDVTLDEVVEHAARARPRDRPAGLRRPRERLRPRPRATPRRRSRAAAEAGAVGGSIEDYDPGGELLRARARGRARRRRRRGGTRASTSRSRSPRAPRTTSAATPTSTTRSRACRPTSAPAPTCSTRPGLRNGDEIRAVCDAVSKPVNVLAHPGLSMGEIVGGRRASG